MTHLPPRALSRPRLVPLLAALFCLAALPAHAAEEPDAPKDGPKGAAVTVLKATKSCFSNIVEVS
jgi:HlyD family secretion protein